jgi:hypothetical protein
METAYEHEIPFFPVLLVVACHRFTSASGSLSIRLT